MRRRTTGSRASTNFLHHPARSLRRLISLLLFVLVRFLTRPTNHPRHAVCASNDESKPVRPQNNVLEQVPLFAVLCKQSEAGPSESNGDRNHI